MEKKEIKALDLDAPLLSLRDLLCLLEIDKNERGNAIGLIIMLGKEKIELKTAMATGSGPLLEVTDGLVNMVPDKKVKAGIKEVSARIEANMDSFLLEQKRTFFSFDDAIKEMIAEKSVPVCLVKAMLGGQWPEHPFNFDCVDSFMIEEDGTLVPDAGFGEPAPGPDFKLRFEMANDPLNLFAAEKEK